MEHLLGTAIAWAFICLFWLAVNVFDGWMQREVYPKLRLRFPRTCRVLDRFGLLGKKVDGGSAAQPADRLRDARRIPQ